jgi:hypothetical protein
MIRTPTESYRTARSTSPARAQAAAGAVLGSAEAGRARAPVAAPGLARVPAVAQARERVRALASEPAREPVPDLAEVPETAPAGAGARTRTNAASC